MHTHIHLHIHRHTHIHASKHMYTKMHINTHHMCTMQTYTNTQGVLSELGRFGGALGTTPIFVHQHDDIRLRVCVSQATNSHFKKLVVTVAVMYLHLGQLVYSQSWVTPVGPPSSWGALLTLVCTKGDNIFPNLKQFILTLLPYIWTTVHVKINLPAHTYRSTYTDVM